MIHSASGNAEKYAHQRVSTAVNKLTHNLLPQF